MPLPSSGPTGNALTDANTGLSVDPVQAATAINTVNLQQAATASDCLWPPSGQITVPIIPGILHQSVQIPCLLTYSEARALVGAGLVFGGLLVVWGGLAFFAVAEALPWAAAVIGVRTGGKKAAAAAEKSETKAATKADVTEAA